MSRSDSEDDVPLARRVALATKTEAGAAVNGGAAAGAAPWGPAGHNNIVAKPVAFNGAPRPAGHLSTKNGRQVVSSDSEDEVPLAARSAAVKAAPSAAAAGTSGKPAVTAAVPRPAAGAGAAAAGGAKPGGGKAAPLIKRKPGITWDDAVQLQAAPAKPKPAAAPAVKRDEAGSSDSEEDQPLATRKANITPAAKTVKKKSAGSSEGGGGGDRKEKKRKARESAQPERERAVKRGKAEGNGSGKIMWKTLVHSGVLFPPEYVPHGVKMLYDGVPVDLTAEQEEVASMFSIMKETDYMNKPQFLKNFWEGFCEVLGPNHRIKSLDKCDFTPIYEMQMADREAKKAISKEEKARLKLEKEAAEAKYKYAVVDGRQEMVGNFRVEPPGLFRGRGEHPKMGKLKKRIYPRDITINIGEGVPVPVPCHPYEGQKWKEVRHDKTVTWLAYWKDPVNTKEYKYVFLAATSAWKSESDLQKYEKARKLKDFIGGIREQYMRNWDSKDRAERQMGTALYFIDKLALRAGHEKDEDEADTVGCCTLKVENVECIAPNHIKFDFLGKDSIRYENTVEVEEKVFKNLVLFKREDSSGRVKKEGEQLFECFDAQDLNVRLKDLMDGLSVKVFRTYNASITLDSLLADESLEESVDAKVAEYNRANKEVAILCNHQRAVGKGHDGQMEKLQEKLDALHAEVAELQAELKLAKAGKNGKDGKALREDAVRNKLDKKKLQLEKTQINAKVKEDLKTVALGTSKINYLDPRITVAWCKRNEVPLEKVFNKSLMSKFLWAMDVEPEFRF